MSDTGLDPKSWRRRLLEAGSGSDMREHAEEIARQSRERWDQLQGVHTAMRAVVQTAVSPRREVSVTAVWGGAISEIKFPTAAYKKMPAAELAGLLQATVSEAQQKVTTAVAGILAPTLPAGVDAAALMSGEADLSKLIPAETGDWFVTSGSADRSERAEEG